MRLFSAIFLVAGLSLYGCATTRAPPRIDLPAPYTDQRVRVTVDGLWKDGDGTVSGVSGTATNISGHDFITCQIGLDLLDVSGVKVSSAVAVTTGLKAGQTWRFQATLMNAYAVAFKSVARNRGSPTNENDGYFHRWSRGLHGARGRLLHTKQPMRRWYNLSKRAMYR